MQEQNQGDKKAVTVWEEKGVWLERRGPGKRWETRQKGTLRIYFEQFQIPFHLCSFPTTP